MGITNTTFIYQDYTYTYIKIDAVIPWEYKVYVFDIALLLKIGVYPSAFILRLLLFLHPCTDVIFQNINRPLYS